MVDITTVSKVDLSCIVQTQSIDAHQNATIKSSKLMP